MTGYTSEYSVGDSDCSEWEDEPDELETLLMNFAFHMNNYCTHAAKGLVNRILARMERGEPWEDIITQFARQYLIKLQNCQMKDQNRTDA